MFICGQPKEFSLVVVFSDSFASSSFDGYAKCQDYILLLVHLVSYSCISRNQNHRSENKCHHLHYQHHCHHHLIFSPHAIGAFVASVVISFAYAMHFVNIFVNDLRYVLGLCCLLSRLLQLEKQEMLKISYVKANK